MEFGRGNLKRSPEMTESDGFTDNKKATSIPPGAFRCPFEIKGDEEGTIVEARFNDDKATRLKLIRASLDYFHKNPSSLAMRFHLPPSLLKAVGSLEELKTAILPYQTEILASELDYRLDPFMPYQMKNYGREELFELFKKNPYKLMSTNLLGETITGHGFSLNNLEDLATWIESIMKSAAEQGIKNPKLLIQGENERRQLTQYLTITPGSAYIHPEDLESVMGPGQDRKNCFGIVKCPFYPKEFGRYSECIEIVMSRMKDFTALSSETRRKIRRQSNTVYKNHGVTIEDLENDKQADGVWIPEYEKG